MTITVAMLDQTARMLWELALFFPAFANGVPAFEATVQFYGASLAGLGMLGIVATRHCAVCSIFGLKTCGA